MDAEPIPTASEFERAERSISGFNEPTKPDLKKASPSTTGAPSNVVMGQLGKLIDVSKPLPVKTHERFSMLVASGVRQTDAYIRTISASCSRVSASRRASGVAKRPEVAARIIYLTKKQELLKPQNPAQEPANIDLNRNNLLDKLREIILNAANPSAAISAIETYAKLASIGPEERDTGQLTPDQAARYAAAAADNLQARLRDSGAIVLEIVTGTARVRQECATLDEARELLEATIYSSAERTPQESQVNNSAQSEQTPANIGETA